MKPVSRSESRVSISTARWTKKELQPSSCSAPDAIFLRRNFKKMMRADHRRLPFSISVDENAAYSDAFTSSQDEKVITHDCKLRRVKYLNNVIEQDHRFVRKKVRASQCFKRFHTTERALKGIEAMNMMRKGQVKRSAGSESQGQANFVASLFGNAAQAQSSHDILWLKQIPVRRR